MNLFGYGVVPDACDTEKASWWANHYQQLLVDGVRRLREPMSSFERAKLIDQMKQWERALKDHRSGRTARVFAFFRHLHAWMRRFRRF